MIDNICFYNFYVFLYSEEEEESEEEGEDPALDSLSQAIAFQVGVCKLQKSLACRHVIQDLWILF